ncbi:glycosyltransferase family 2 protein [Algibacter sp. Ld11]|uniref:glycosyltransferase family 2 protein n=1 Tax=Algibacter sp. Ld11 TaxID=649150 RepID=UPI003862F99D
MLSVLIPTYNYNIVPLVEEIKEQLNRLEINYEILVYDDGSHSKLNEYNSSITNRINCDFKALPTNIGRSAIRNLLSKDAKFNNLLFIDAGTFPKNKRFIKNYISQLHHDVIIGGMTHLKTSPKKPYKLRWLYTKNREGHETTASKNKVICSSNFLIKKDIILSNPFDETIKKYGCEDVVFFNTLIMKNYEMHHIKNPVIHDALDDSATFINKTEQAIQNLITLLNSKKIDKNHYNLSRAYIKLEKYKLTGIISFLYKGIKPVLNLNFQSNYPSLFLYDFYRLGYFCTLKQNKS